MERKHSLEVLKHEKFFGSAYIGMEECSEDQELVLKTIVFGCQSVIVLVAFGLPGMELISLDGTVQKKKYINKKLLLENF